MNELKKLAYEKAINFRDKYELGNYCSRELLHILNLIEVNEKLKVKLIRTPLINENVAGFIGYKYDTFIIVTNTNKTLGSERFTIAHEIYHLLENRVSIKVDPVIEKERDFDNKDITEIMANSFSAELLMPKNSIIENLDMFTNHNKDNIDIETIVKLQQLYGVDYVAMTKRLTEIDMIDEDKRIELESYLAVDGKLEEMTIKLGYNNDINKPSRDTYLLQEDLDIIRKNYENGYTSYDDLVRIFGYLGCEPEKFGYTNTIELTNEAKDFMKSLLE